MSPRKSAQDAMDAEDYQAVFTKVCVEEDVLIIPVVKRWMSVCDSQRKLSEKTEPMASEMDVDDVLGSCRPLRPVVNVAYDRSESGECISGVICKGFYLEYALVHAIFRTLSIFSSVTCLKIVDCCISRDVVRVLSSLLAKQENANIFDLSLDGNADIGDEVPSLLRTDLRHLSLKRCCLDDRAVSGIAQELHFKEDRKQKLLSLNLNMNCIGDAGMLALATALRTNRTLISLSLCGNRISDVGASYVVEVMGKFLLNDEEVMCRRRRIFDRFLHRKAIFDKLMQDWKLKIESEAQMKNRSLDRFTGKKTRLVEVGVKRVSTASGERKRANVARMSSREKSRGKKKSGECDRDDLHPTNSELKEIMLRVDSEMIPDRHPFITEVSQVDGELWCDGCWKLGDLNLSFNRITEHSVCKFIEVIKYQDAAFRFPCSGLLRLTVQPGSLIPDHSCKVAQLECALRNRRQKKENSTNGSETDRLQSESGPFHLKSSFSPKKKYERTL